ncbi:hypothetical protein TNCV_878711 [Trichonephila clavipes]|nr:hypothetical protein TNCV_878711 [Trichonephila clavipes]
MLMKDLIVLSYVQVPRPDLDLEPSPQTSPCPREDFFHASASLNGGSSIVLGLDRRNVSQKFGTMIIWIPWPLTSP